MKTFSYAQVDLTSGYLFEKEELNRKINFLKDSLDASPEVTITYFVHDSKKSGGAYVDASGIVSKIKEFENLIILESGVEIPVDEYADSISAESSNS